MSSFSDLQKRADQVRALYGELNEKNIGKQWDAKDYAMGFAGDLGDLLKLVTAKEGMRKIDDVDTKLEHELADCIWSVMMLANHYNIDLERAFTQTMDELESRIKKA